MPIIKANGKLLYFAHIPKCGGTSVERYLEHVSESVVFLDRSHNLHDKKTVWSLTSPQHIDATSFERLFPSQDFFYSYFTVVREPMSRFVSAFKHQKYIDKRINHNVSPEEFLMSLSADQINAMGAYDNHFMPMVRFLREGAEFKVFRIEDGLNKLKNWIESEILGRGTEFEIGRDNTSMMREKIIEDFSLSDDAISYFKHLYAEDIDSFGYSDVTRKKPESIIVESQSHNKSNPVIRVLKKVIVQIMPPIILMSIKKIIRKNPAAD